MNQQLPRIITLPVLIIFLFVASFSSWAQTEVVIPKNNLKMTLLSLGSGSSRFSYERAINDHQSAEITIGLIGWGWDILNHSNPQGYIIKLAPKWNLHHVGEIHHSLSGFYVKPELMYANYNYLYDYNSNLIDKSDSPLPSQSTSGTEFDPYEHTSQIALMAEGGFQIIANWFVFDIYTGLGPTFGTGNKNNYYHGFMRFPQDGFLAFTAGFRIGVAF